MMKRGWEGVGYWLALASVLSGCALEATDVDEENVESSSQALTNDGIYMGASGRIGRRAGAIGYEKVTSMHIFNAMRATDWPTKSPQRYGIIDWADWENYAEDMAIYGRGDTGLCGAEARAHYGTNDELWCTEYARWIFRKGGLRNIRYCETSFFGCVDYEYLDEMTNVSDMVELFTENGGWINRASLKADDIEPGDYMAMTTQNIRKNHSAVVMAVSADRRWFYTSEGNNGDCVRFVRRRLVEDSGALNSIIDGIGKVNVAF